MMHGNIYPQDQVDQALTHFFRTDNLIALRELALRFLADETDEELLDTSGSMSRTRGGRPASESW
jgi:two-component system sensor histidine kinase KdpD